MNEEGIPEKEIYFLKVRWLGAGKVTIEKKSWDQIMEQPESQAFELSTLFLEKETTEDVFVRG